LTSDEYTIRGDEGLIWMEFTKTSHRATEAPVRDAPEEKINAWEKRKNNQLPEYYFDRASKNRPIRSSIPLVVAGAEKLARNAASAAERAERSNRIFIGAGILAIAGTVVGLFSLFMAVNTNVTATHNLIESVSSRATQAAFEAKQAQDDAKGLRTQIEAADVRRSADELRQIHAQLDAARAQIETLKGEVQRLIDQTRTQP
jgi:hypothetical protein